MSRSGKWYVLTIDALGAGVVAVFLFGAVWFAAIHGDRTDDETRRLKRTIGNAHRELLSLRAQRDHQKATLAEHEAQLADRGQLPTYAPIEEYFQTLSSLADRHQLRVVRHNPLSARSYPGLEEQRYAYEVHGTIPNLTRFLKAIEGATFWADVSYLRIVEGQGGTRGNDRVALLTISVFSALPQGASPESG